jgi:magnesium transporter
MITSYFIENKKLVTKKGYCKKCQWLNIEGMGEEEVSLLQGFGFHELAIEDVFKGKQRMKVEDYKDYLFISVSTIETGVVFLNFYCFLSKDRIITISNKELCGDDDVVKHCQKNPEWFSRGPDFILYLILDRFTDEYFPLLDELDENLDTIEKKLFLHPTEDTARKLLALKRKTVLFRRNIVGLRDLVISLRQFEDRFMRKGNIFYFQNLFDHLIRLSDKTDLLREMINTAFEGYLSILSNSLNEIMKRLTAITVILMLPTLIAGIYGMNFRIIPVSQNFIGFYAIVGIMSASVIILFYYFKKQRWL